MGIVAKRIITIPYSLHELDRKRINASHKEKIISEETISEFAPHDQNELERAVRDLCDEYATSPIILIGTESIRDSFVVGRRYRRNARNALYEMIVYRINDLKAYEEEAERLIRDPETHERFLKYAGFKSEEEYRKYLLRNEGSKDGFPQFTLAQVLALNVKSKLRRNVLHSLGLGRARDADNPKMVLNDNTTIVFRVIGRNLEKVGNHRRYYCELHKIGEPTYYFTNLISTDDGMWVTEKNPKFRAK